METRIDEIKFKRNGKFIAFSNQSNKTIIFENLPEMTSPFGVEKYNNKQIINFTLKQKNNEEHNFLSKLKTIEETFKNQNDDIIPINILQLIKGKEFSESLKDAKNNKYLLRTHIGNNVDVFLITNDEKMFIEQKHLNKNPCKIVLELKGMWIEDSTYGLYWNVLSANVLKLTNNSQKID
jgi:hypothetical protein